PPGRRRRTRRCREVGDLMLALGGVWCDESVPPAERIMPRHARVKILTPAIDPSRRGDAPGAPRCRCCGRPHGVVVRCLADGRWYDPDAQTWRDSRGRRAPWPDVIEYATTEDLVVAVRPVRGSGTSTGGTSTGAPRLLCRRCQMVEEGIRARIRARMRRAVGDLFLGRYDAPGTFERFLALKWRRG
ncbi:MAG TPA: hypothetical protein VGE72_31335, partial [Azospirillum sp.]